MEEVGKTCSRKFSGCWREIQEEIPLKIHFLDGTIAITAITSLEFWPEFHSKSSKLHNKSGPRKLFHEPLSFTLRGLIL